MPATVLLILTELLGGMSAIAAEQHVQMLEERRRSLGVNPDSLR
jgi:hypothetical protein